MNQSLMPQQHPTFCLDSMMHAMPLRDCYSQRIPTEILGYIFESLSPTPPMPLTSALVTASHVCRRWRHVINSMSWLWTDLVMHTTRFPEIFAQIVSRSKHHCFRLAINRSLTARHLSDAHDKVTFKETFKIVRKNVARIRGLHVTANNEAFFLIFNKYLANVHFPQLADLSLCHLDSPAKRFDLGPVSFNPAVLTKLHLHSVMIDCEATCLAGLRVAELINSSGTLLDQHQLLHATYPAIPAEPIITNLRELTIESTSLVMISDKSYPSFQASSLRVLTLASILSPTEEAATANRRLFSLTYSRNLEYLACNSLDERSFDLFLLPMQIPGPPRYPMLRMLLLVHVDLEQVGPEVLRSFPRVDSLTLAYLVPNRLLVHLLDVELMPMLHFIFIESAEGKIVIPRPRPAPAITVPSQPI